MKPASQAGPGKPGKSGRDVVLARKLHNETHAEEQDENEPWLLSYADMVTLLMCFFILFFSIDKTKGGIADPERLKIRLESLIAIQVPSSQGARGPREGAAAESGKTAELVEKLRAQLLKVPKQAKVIFSLATPEPGIIEMTLLSEALFDPGKAQVTTTGAGVLGKIVPRLRELDPRATIEVEGHTDSTPIKSGAFPSNWELSTARAAAVARFFVDQGVAPGSLMLSGYGDKRPLVAETDAQGRLDVTAQRLNRRIVVRLHVPVDDGGAVPTAPRPSP